MKVCFLKTLESLEFSIHQQVIPDFKGSQGTVFGCLLSRVFVELVRLAATGRSCLYYKEPTRQPNESIKASLGCDQPSLARCPGPQLLHTGLGQVYSSQHLVFSPVSYVSKKLLKN